ncbi:acyltransferase, partial [Rhizobium leguminosarum]|uniref:acyltransferase n=1 Tax=Rhizobium leguminosarum TaxID=384 RepID=UPI003F9948D7
LYLHTRIGKRCFVCARSIILPGVEIGDECVIGSGSVVTKNVPPRSLVAGNPANIFIVLLQSASASRSARPSRLRVQCVRNAK